MNRHHVCALIGEGSYRFLSLFFSPYLAIRVAEVKIKRGVSHAEVLRLAAGRIVSVRLLRFGAEPHLLIVDHMDLLTCTIMDREDNVSRPIAILSRALSSGVTCHHHCLPISAKLRGPAPWGRTASRVRLKPASRSFVQICRDDCPLLAFWHTKTRSDVGSNVSEQRMDTPQVLVYFTTKTVAI